MKQNSQASGRNSLVRLLVAATAVLALVFALTACGGSDSSGSTEASSPSSSETESAKTSNNGAVSAAQKVIKPYIGQPSAFPVTEKLKEIPKGAKIAYADCGTAVCALMWELLTSAAKTMGVQTTRIKTGPTAEDLTTGFDSILQMEPDGLLAVATEIGQWEKQLNELQESGVTVATTGIGETEKYGINAAMSGTAQNLLAGELMANYVIAEMNPEANVVIYEVPELSFSGEIASTFVKEIEAKCEDCTVRIAKVPVATLGNTSATTIVSDLQANPETNVVAFASPTLASGLPQAMQSAGIEIETLSYAPETTELQYLKEGKLTAGLGFDIPVSVWSLLDMMAREIVGQPLSGPESEGYAVSQFLTPEDITFDPSKGWTGYPNFPEMFAKLWGVEG